MWTRTWLTVATEQWTDAVAAQEKMLITQLCEGPSYKPYAAHIRKVAALRVID